MGIIYVGVGELAASRSPGDVVKILALGSCVGVIMLAPQQKIVGLLHVALPDSSINAKRGIEKPGTFADTGIPQLLNELKKMGHLRGKLTVKLAGGASIMDPNNTFNIGKRNILAIKKILWKFGLGAIAEDLGGNYCRTLSVDVDSGLVTISSPGRGTWPL
ncbi:MAG: chemotaxis protein CheD [bacterium]|nr:chemotaxis protein CheD [bacterium]